MRKATIVFLWSQRVNISSSNTSRLLFLQNEWWIVLMSSTIWTHQNVLKNSLLELFVLHSNEQISHSCISFQHVEKTHFTCFWYVQQYVTADHPSKGLSLQWLQMEVQSRRCWCVTFMTPFITAGGLTETPWSRWRGGERSWSSQSLTLHPETDPSSAVELVLVKVFIRTGHEVQSEDPPRTKSLTRVTDFL